LHKPTNLPRKQNIILFLRHKKDSRAASRKKWRMKWRDCKPEMFLRYTCAMFLEYETKKTRR